jgi:hypothetical protein
MAHMVGHLPSALKALSTNLGKRSSWLWIVFASILNKGPHSY